MKIQMRAQKEKSRSVCMACGRQDAYRAISVCIDCFLLMDRLTFQGCVRCGKRECVGSCNNLGDFRSLECLMGYRPPFSTMLKLCKGSQRRWPLPLFENLFSMRFKLALLRLIREQQINTVILCPVRMSRLFRGQWHTHASLLRWSVEVLKSPSMVSLEVRPKIIVRKSWHWKPQASRPAAERHQEVAKLVKRRKMGPLCALSYFRGLAFLGVLCISRSDKKVKTSPPNGVLLVDDVLTSGGTALRVAHTFGRAFPESIFHLLVLMRAPFSHTSPNL
jgi:predicted amidophosphoribosyltransferase